MLVLHVGNQIPRDIASCHIGHLGQICVIVVLLQSGVGTCIGNAGTQGATCLEAVEMVESQRPILLVAPRVVRIPQGFPIRHIGHFILVVVNQTREPQRERACFGGGDIELETQILIIERLLLHIDGMQFLGDFQKTVTVVHQVGSFGLLAQRTFRTEINTQRAHLNGMLVFGVVAHTHLHVESTREGQETPSC